MRGLSGRRGRPAAFGPDGAHGHGDGLRGQRGGRRQARRGAIRHAILTLLAEQPMHGYQVMQELATRSAGRWAPSAGSVYPTLQQLEDEGLVSVVDDGGRKTFDLTEAGKTAVEAMPTERPWSGPAEGADLRGLMRELGTAAIQVARVGSPAATAQAQTVLVDARRRLYRILADDGEADGQALEQAADDSAE
jgi:DNA-binding PadR family transcriptional regulator